MVSLTAIATSGKKESNMYTRYIIAGLSLLVTALSLPTPLRAQDNPDGKPVNYWFAVPGGKTPRVAGDPARRDRQDMESIWIRNTDNAAGGIVDAPARQSSAEFSYDSAKGDYKPAQVGDDNGTLNFYTQGGGIYKNLGGWYIWGEFKYSNENISGARWNSTLVDPLRDEPFFLADSSYSKWKNQKYHLLFKAATPVLCDRIVLGMTGSYDVAAAAKQVDPRPYTRMSKVELMPSVLFMVDGHNTIGANFRYYSYREDGSASSVNYLVDRRAWQMVAPGFFNSGIISATGGSVISLRNYNANAFGGGLQYSYANGRLKSLLAANYTYKVEDVTGSYTQPRMIGTVKDRRFDIVAAGQYDLDGGILFLNYRHARKSYDGIEYVQTYDSSYEIQTWVTHGKFVRSNFKNVSDEFSVDYMVTDGRDAYTWKFGASARHEKDGFVYFVPRSTKDYANTSIAAYAAHNLCCRNGHALLVSFDLGYLFNDSKSLDYNGIKADDICYKEFTLLDYEYATTACLNLGLDLTWSFPLDGNYSMFAGGSYKYFNPDGDVFKNRRLALVKVGISF